MTSFSKSKILLLFTILIVAFIYCSKDETIPPRYEQPLSVEIIAGPEDNGAVMNNAHFTFEWRVLGGEGEVYFEYMLQGVDESAVTTTDFSHTYPGLEEGSYTFTITAKDAEGNSDSETRTFTVTGSLYDPEVLISGARGSQSSGGSGVIPEYAPGVLINLTWTGSDDDRFGDVEGYRYKTTDGGTFTEWSLGTTVAFAAPSTEGTYTFTLEAKDNTGVTSTATFQYKVKTPEILIMDDLTFSNALGEINCDTYYEKIFDGYAYDVIDIAQDGLPGSIGSQYKVIVWYGESSDTWTNIGAAYPETSLPITDFIDGGGKLWAMGWGILEALRFNPSGTHENPPAADEFEAKYLHISTTEAWARAGEGSGDFSFAIDVLGQSDKYPKLKVGVGETGGDVDAIAADEGAEIVYTGTTGLDEPVGDVALRYPTGGTNTDVFFMTFPLFVSNTNRVALAAASTLVQTIMTEMGQ